MNIREQYEQETGLKPTLSHFGLPDDYSTRYVEWLENKLSQKPEVSEGTLIRPKDIADRLLRLGYRGVSDGIDDNIRGIQRLLWHNFENSDGQDKEKTAEKIGNMIADIIMILDQS